MREVREVAPACPHSLRPDSRPASLSRVDPELCAFGPTSPTGVGMAGPIAQRLSGSDGALAARAVNYFAPMPLVVLMSVDPAGAIYCPYESRARAEYVAVCCW